MKTIKCLFLLIINSVVEIPEDLGKYLKLHLLDIVREPRRLLELLQKSHYKIFKMLYPYGTYQDNIWEVDNLKVEFRILKLMKVNALTNSPFIYDMVFEIYINEVKIPSYVYEDIALHLLEDFNHGFYMEYNLTLNNLCRVIEI